MDHIRFLSYGDIHHDELSSKCVVLEDTIKIERAIFDRAREGKFDFTLFCGDRFLKREPRDKVKVTADRVIYDKVHKGTIPHFHLIGNHDFVTNQLNWSTSESLKIFNNVSVMDESKTYRYSDNVLIHALPADFKFDIDNYECDNSCLNIFTMHDTIRGAYLNDDRTMQVPGGIDLSAVDRSEFDILLSGDIHVRSKLPLKNTGGGYLGAAVQLTRADSNRKRGWTEVSATRQNKDSKWIFDVKFVPTRNLFTRISFGIDNRTEFKDLNFDKEDFLDQFVEVKLIGDKANVDRMADDKCWLGLQKKLKPRKIEILRAYEVEQSDVVVDLTASTGVLDDLSTYLDSKFASLGVINRDKVADVVRRLKRQEGPIQ